MSKNVHFPQNKCLKRANFLGTFNANEENLNSFFLKDILNFFLEIAMQIWHLRYFTNNLDLEFYAITQIEHFYAICVPEKNNSLYFYLEPGYIIFSEEKLDIYTILKS